MNWCVGDKIVSLRTGAVFELVRFKPPLSQAKLIRLGNDSLVSNSSPIYIRLKDFKLLESRKGKPHPLTNIFKN